MAGKKYPVPVDTYIGKITPEGIEQSGLKKISVDNPDVIVKEYGFSRSMELLCPVSWKEPLGNAWPQVLDFIIVRESPESYIPQIREVPEALDPHIQLGAQKSALQRRMKKEFGIEIKELRVLLTIYIVSIGDKKLISKISNEQSALLAKLALNLEVV